MKTLVTITILSFLVSLPIEAKKSRNIATQDIARYGLEINQINTGSGHGTGYTLNAQVNKGRKGLEVGLIFNSKDEKLAGGDFRYKVFLGSPYRVTTDNKNFKPYLQYNLVYQKGMSTGNEMIMLDGNQYEMKGEAGMVATMGHYVGYGNRIKLFNSAYLDSSFGFGVYQGSVDKINGPGTIGYHDNNYGVTYSFKIGFGYTFN